MSFDFLTLNGLVQIFVYFAVLFACVKPLGSYMAKVYAGEPTWTSKLLGSWSDFFIGLQVSIL